MKRRLFILAWLVSLAALSSATALARGPSGGRGGGPRGGGWHGGGGWRGGPHGGGGYGYRPFRGGHWGWAPWWGLHGGFWYSGYAWPYGVPWVIYPANVPGYAGVVPDAVPIVPPAPVVVLHLGEVTGINVGLRFQLHCDNTQAIVATLESAGGYDMALVLRGNAAGEANCRVSDGNIPPLDLHVVVLPQPGTPTYAPPPPPREPPPPPPAP